VLVCENEPDACSLLCAIVEQMGLVADVAQDTAHAKQMLKQNSYVAMTLNLMLPGQGGGVALIRELRAAKETAALPILVVSDNATVICKELAEETLGVFDWIDKPVNRALLETALKQAAGLYPSEQPALQFGNISKNSHDKQEILDLSLPEGSGAVRDYLEREVARAKRKKTPLSFAMIRIDLFERIEEAYGHSVGERLVQSLLRLLRQKLRQTDLIGRYGAEELAVVLCDTDGETAVTVLDKIRKEFSQLQHWADGKEWSATFSCGIADISRFEDAIKLGHAADNALDEAKHKGCNQVVLG